MNIKKLIDNNPGHNKRLHNQNPLAIFDAKESRTSLSTKHPALVIFDRFKGQCVVVSKTPTK